jgi:outer membrane protein OmpA-like peptidoglycan-associated protein
MPHAATALPECSSAGIEVRAHTGSRDQKADNQKLPDVRDNSVIDYLVEKGVARKPVIPKDFGEEQSIASNDTADGTQ